MKYSYNKLWKILIDKNMKKKDLINIAHVASSTVAKMSKEQAVSLDVLARICQSLKCNIGDVLEIIY